MGAIARRTAPVIVIALLVLAAPSGARVRRAAPDQTVVLIARPATVGAGHPVRLTVELGPLTTGTMLSLYANPYPFRRSTLLETIPTASSRSFAVTVHPDRITRYHAVLSTGGAGATARVGVIGRAVTKARALPLGRARVTLVLFHPRDLPWNGARVRWWFASGRTGRFRAAPATRTRRLSPYVTTARTAVALPAGGYRFRACFNVPGARALLNPRRPPGCSGRGYHGGGFLPVGFPGPGAVGRAGRYLAARAGLTGFAVVDSEGRLSGADLNRPFITGSVVKAMLLVAYLRHLAALGQRHVDPQSASFLYPMIHVSDNRAATQTQSYVGDAGLDGVARAAGMANFSVFGSWGTALLTPADQAQFFFAMDSLVPSQFVGYARFLLSTIVDYESWGIPAIARPRGYRVFFKGGWRPTPRGQLVNQIARLEGHGRRFALAVMTDGDPSMAYGIETIQGLTAALLG
ncbi:MAG: hypothetical protein ACRDNK_02960 [Solirubrobacteraceae bacterium]